VDPRAAALSIWQAALAAGEVGALLRNSLQRRGDVLQVGEHSVDLAGIDRVFVLGCGKAGAPMARAVEEKAPEANRTLIAESQKLRGLPDIEMADMTSTDTPGTSPAVRLECNECE
jgi:glycerate-2-kinase